jgi:hypothetical protein
VMSVSAAALRGPGGGLSIVYRAAAALSFFYSFFSFLHSLLSFIIVFSREVAL